MMNRDEMMTNARLEIMNNYYNGNLKNIFQKFFDAITEFDEDKGIEVMSEMLKTFTPETYVVAFLFLSNVEKGFMNKVIADAELEENEYLSDKLEKIGEMIEDLEDEEES